MASGTLAPGAVAVGPFVADAALAGSSVKKTKVKGDKPPEPIAAKIEPRQRLDKGPRSPIRAMDAAENDLCGVPYIPPCRSDASTAKKGWGGEVKGRSVLRGSGVIVALLASAGAIGALVAFSGGNDGPTSP